MAKKAVKLDLSEVMVCRDVQQSRNGTFSLLNVYPKDIAIAAHLPVNLKLSLWMNFLSILPEDGVVEVKISGKRVLEKDVVVSVTLAAQPDKKAAIAVPVILRNIVLNILQAGEIQISYKVPKAKWVVARTIELNITEPA